MVGRFLFEILENESRSVLSSILEGLVLAWAVAQTRTLCERRVVDDLLKRDHESYCPFVQRKRFHRGQKILTSHAMFPGYVFVKLIKDRWYEIFNFDVVKILLSGGVPAKVDDGVIDGLRSLERNGFIKLPLPPLYHRGQRIKVKAGQFSGLHGFYDGPGSKHTERVLVQLLGRWVPVHVSIDSLVSVG